MWSERSETQKATYAMISFIWNIENRQIHRDRKQISGCQEAGVGENGKYCSMGMGFALGMMKIF